jgi:hypothetical protein
MAYREKPGHEWVHDTRGFYYFGPEKQLAYSNGIRSLKENIHTFSLSTAAGTELTVHGAGRQACQFDRVNKSNTLIINELWDYPDLMWGNYMKLISLPARLQGSVTISIHTKN